MFIDNFGYLILLLAILFHVTLKKDSNYSETCKIKIKTSLLQTQTNQNYVCVIHAEFLKKNTQHFQFQLNKIEYSFAKCFADYNYYLSRNNINQSFSSRLESSKHRDTRLPSEVSSFKPKTKQIILPYRITHLAARGLLSRGSRTTGEGGCGGGVEGRNGDSIAQFCQHNAESRTTRLEQAQPANPLLKSLVVVRGGAN